MTTDMISSVLIIQFIRYESNVNPKLKRSIAVKSKSTANSLPLAIVKEEKKGSKPLIVGPGKKPYSHARGLIWIGCNIIWAAKIGGCFVINELF